MGQLWCYVILLLLLIISIHGKFILYDYCIIGAGPGGKMNNHLLVIKNKYTGNLV